jgi:hypothetical protein
VNIPIGEISSSDIRESSSSDLKEPTPKREFKINIHDSKIFRKIPSLPSRKSPLKSDLWLNSPVKERKLPKKVEPELVKLTFEDIPETQRMP